MKFVRHFEEFRFGPKTAPAPAKPETIPAKPARPAKPQEPAKPVKPEIEVDPDEIERPVVEPDPMAKKKEDEYLNKVVKRFHDESNKLKK